MCSVLFAVTPWILCIPKETVFEEINELFGKRIDVFLKQVNIRTYVKENLCLDNSMKNGIYVYYFSLESCYNAVIAIMSVLLLSVEDSLRRHTFRSWTFFAQAISACCLSIRAIAGPVFSIICEKTPFGLSRRSS